ncbi:MAG: hypothetical protein ACI9J5_001784, partial [Paraglaciecola sp.]
MLPVLEIKLGSAPVKKSLLNRARDQGKSLVIPF